MKDRKRILALTTLILLGVLCVTEAFACDLSFQQRVEAQRAIERVSYSHLIGASRPFDEVVTQTVLETKVRTYLAQSRALDTFWKTPVTEVALRREMERMAHRSRAPERLREIQAALHNDAFLVQECLVRPVLVDRLARSFFATDSRIHAESRAQADSMRQLLLSGALSIASLTSDSRFRVVRIVRSEAGDPPKDDPAENSLPRGPGGDLQLALSPQKYADLRTQVPEQAGGIGLVQETREAFVLRVLLSEEAGSVRLATFTREKTTWDAWWQNASSSFDAAQVHPVAGSSTPLPSLIEPSSTESRTVAGSSQPPGCPPDDVWDSSGSLDDYVPSERSLHSAIWTGSLMIVWGGFKEIEIEEPLRTGGRYDPATDTWTPTSVVGAPSSRYGHNAVWTGSLMLVWGGNYGGNLDGGRYDPVTDTWAPISGLHAPTNLVDSAAVWTGSMMVVWGGISGLTGTGGRYDPVGDVWSPVTGVGAPPRLLSQGAVWSGSEMIVWGFSPNYNVMTGGRYDPVADAWEPVSVEDAPSGSSPRTIVWTGSAMFASGGGQSGLYDPSTDTWRRTSTVGAPPATSSQSAVWTGTSIIVWGSEHGQPGLGGGLYNPSSDVWTPTSRVNAPLIGSGHSSVWTGTRMIVWGGSSTFGPPHSASGGRYDPITDSWTPTATSSAPRGRHGHTAVWTGSEMIVFGGIPEITDTDRFGHLSAGARYDPATGSWRSISTVNEAGGRAYHTAVWTGREMIVWGGRQGFCGPCSHQTSLGNGARYDPLLDSWTPVSTFAAPTRREEHTAVWTGHLMVVWGGYYEDDDEESHYLETGGRYDPESNLWTSVSIDGAPRGRRSHTAVWTGGAMVVWGGNGARLDPLDTGGRYDPLTNAWAPLSMVGAPSSRFGHTAVWIGSEMLVWGGSVYGTGGRYNAALDAWLPLPLGGVYPGTSIWTGDLMVVWNGSEGSRYDPDTKVWGPVSTIHAPFTRGGHSAVWTGESMLVWGGRSPDDFLESQIGGRYLVAVNRDEDEDGYGVCDGDCDDSNALVHPGAVEVCNGIDDDCDATVDDGAGGLCDDSDACNGSETCAGAAGCRPGTPLVCNDGNICTDNACDPARGCDFSNNGRCTLDPKTVGYWKALCRSSCRSFAGLSGDGAAESHCPAGESLTLHDVDCVKKACTFSDVGSIDDLCQALDSHEDSCGKARAEFIALRLNLCRGRVEEATLLESNCRHMPHFAGDDELFHGDGPPDPGVNTTVGAVAAEVDAFLCPSTLRDDGCKLAECLAKHVNNGDGLQMNSLRLAKAPGGALMLSWTAPIASPQAIPSHYRVWRRIGESGEFTLIAEVSVLSFEDRTPPPGNCQYDVTPVW